MTGRRAPRAMNAHLGDCLADSPTLTEVRPLWTGAAHRRAVRGANGWYTTGCDASMDG